MALARSFRFMLPWDIALLISRMAVGSSIKSVIPSIPDASKPIAKLSICLIPIFPDGSMYISGLLYA